MSTAADHNIAPGTAPPVVFERARPDGQGTSRLLRPVTWGSTPPRGYRGRLLINARSETVLERPTFRQAAIEQRCLIPADGWYEWKACVRPGNGARGRTRRPYYFQAQQDGILGLAGLLLGPIDPTEQVFVILTTAAEPALAAIHDRRPLVIPPGLRDAWLDPAVREPDQIAVLLQGGATGSFRAYPVSPRVNSSTRKGADLIVPVPEDPPRPEDPSTLF